MIDNTNGNPKSQNPKSKLRLLVAILFGLIAFVVCANYMLGMIPQTTAKYQAAAVKERLRNLKNFVRYYAEDNNNTLPSRKQLVDALVDFKRSELLASIESGQIEYPNGGTNLSKADPALPLFVARYKDKDGKSVVVTVPISDVLTSESPGKAKN